MSVGEYTQNGNMVAYRVTIRRNTILVVQEYFHIKDYQSKLEARKAASQRNREVEEAFRISDIDRFITEDNRIFGLLLEKDKRGTNILRMQAQVRGERLIRQWSLSKYHWEDVFELAVKQLLKFYQIPLSHELAMKIESVKINYNPSRKSSWKKRTRKPRFRYYD